ncbi:hypothetical protein K439DRAFT_1621466 [Ramaria rubella]|nr:hypothetical protein K439DRAFT_1621466 [Ramaria rubella]
MPALKKKRLQAKQQRASGGFRFNSGLANDLLELTIDPMYFPKEQSGESNLNVDILPCVFSLIGETIEESDEEDVDKPGSTCQVGRKRPYAAVTNNIEILDEPDLETADVESSVQKACDFWKALLSEESQKFPIKPVKKYPATYSGMSRSAVCACEWQLEQAEIGSQKVTHFFHPKLKQHTPAPSPSPVPQQAIKVVDIDSDEEISGLHMDDPPRSEGALTPADESSDEFMS